MKIFFYVQHLLGIGHLRRAATLAQAFEKAGFQVTLASGGRPVEGYRVLQLPPASSDAEFKQLLDENGKPVDDAWKRRRREALLDAYAAAAPDVLLIELFPFGRRQMRFELLPLLAMATQSAKRPLIVCSVRDVIQSKPEREAEIAECFEHYYDRLLVHGDPRVAGFERSFGATELTCRQAALHGVCRPGPAARGQRGRRWRGAGVGRRRRGGTPTARDGNRGACS